MTHQPANTAIQLSLTEARIAGCTERELDVISLRNLGLNWRDCARSLGITRSGARSLWSRAYQRIAEGPVSPWIARDDPTIGNEQLLRGIPVSGYGGAVKGTRPDVEAGRLDRRP